MNYWTLTFIWLLYSLQGQGVVAKASFHPVQLKCEHKFSPLGVEMSSPRFAWWVDASERGFKQAAYQIMVASAEDKLSGKQPDVWNSGKVTSAENFFVAYAGKPLQSAQRYYWKVRIWDQSGKASAWSEAATFVTGLLHPEAWSNAYWIAYELLPDSMKVIPGVHGSGDNLGNLAKKRAVIPYFRKELSLQNPIKEALLFVSGLGHYEFYINGKKVGNDFLTPGWTDYAESCLYNTYDVTEYLQNGDNALGAMVGTGFFYVNRERYRKLVTAQGYPMLRAKLIVKLADGSVQEILTDKSWKTSPSPVTFTSIYGGEDYNANLEQQGWNQPDFNDKGWKPALIAEGPGGQMKAQIEYPLQVMDTIEVQDMASPQAEKYIYDFGQNASGIIHLKVQGKKGDTVRITPAELLNEEGLPYQGASGGPYYFEYILKGDGVEEWTPSFTYYGFRYAMVEGAVPVKANQNNRKPQVVTLQLLHTRNSAPATGTFACSNPLLNQIHELILWSVKSNFASVATDCPHREKLGWLEVVHLIGGSIKHNFDIYHLYKKIIHDMMEAQLPHGLVPDIAPEYVPFEGGFRDSPEWGSASVIVPWYVYQWYGDSSVLHHAYPMMKAYVAYLRSKAENHILSHGLGDWFDLGPETPGPSQLTPIALTATAIYYYDAAILTQIASLLGHKADADKYQKLADEIKDAFNRKFFDEEKKVIATGSQTSYAMPLFVGLVDEEDKPQVFQNLVDSIQANDKALTAGDVGYSYLVRALDQGGAAELLYDMNNRQDVPGYGYQLAHGATALTESWPALKYVSNNHMMLGHLMEWFYSGLGGIRQQEGSIGYSKIRITPQLVEDLDWTEASYEAISGSIKVHWKRNSNGINLKVDIPANTEAEIVLPEAAIHAITESGHPAKTREGIENIKNEHGKMTMTVASGSYDFNVPFEYNN